MLNIRSKAVQETLEFPLLDADDTPLVDDDGKPCMAEVYGPGSKVYVAATARRQAKVLHRAQRGKDLAPPTVAETAEFLADITARLDVAYDDLEGRAKHLAIFKDIELGFVAKQVAEKASDWGNFSKGSAKS